MVRIAKNFQLLSWSLVWNNSPSINLQRIPKLQAEDQAKWWDTLGKFQKLFRKAALALQQQGKMDSDAVHNYFMSGKALCHTKVSECHNAWIIKKRSLVTEREVINGILNVKNTKNHCLAYIRYINNINLQNLKKASLFVDIINRSLDTESAKLLGNLRDERLPAKIESSNLQKWVYRNACAVILRLVRNLPRTLYGIC